MTGTFCWLLGRIRKSSDSEPIGEDMVPSPDALAERTALSKAASQADLDSSVGPFRSAAIAPMRDFTG